MSRTELARLFLSPAEPKLLDQLLSDGRITAEQRQLAVDQPLCDFLTCEADSGGHTDNKRLVCGCIGRAEPVSD